MLRKEGFQISETNEKTQAGKKGLRWQDLVILLTLFMIVFIVFSGLWERSSFGSMLGYTQGVYSKTDDWQGINQQYDQMKASVRPGRLQVHL